ncbi:proline dehydrogenase [Ascochyta lentis]
MFSSIARSVLPATQYRVLTTTRRLYSSSTGAAQSSRYAQVIATTKHATRKNKKAIYAVAGTGVVCLLTVGLIRNREDVREDPRDVKALSTVPLTKLCSGWIAFAFCSVPIWVDVSESLYNVVSKIPVVSSMSNTFVMRTFFNQFLGGETTEDCIPKIEDLRKRQIGTLLGYNIEAELDGSSKDPQLIMTQTEHVLSSIDAQAKLAKQHWPDASATGGDNRFWVRIKVTGLLPHPVALYRGSKAILKARADKGLDTTVPLPGLPHDGDWEAALSGKDVTQADREQLLALRSTLESIASKARDNNVRIVIDAEQSWYQPVIDSLTDELMQKYNTLDGPATCIASFQAYLRRHPALIDQQIRRADEKGFKLLFKQVRGAYMVTEASRHREEGRQGQGPVWSTKAETDASFNYGIEKTLDTVANQIREGGKSRISAVFATHNSISVDLGISLLEKYGLAELAANGEKLVVRKEVAGSVAFAQLYGMKDDLTNKITGSLTTDGGFPLVVKVSFVRQPLTLLVLITLIT